MIDIDHFFNDGFGWICRACDRELGKAEVPAGHHSRAFREGEAETKNPVLSTIALAKWTDKTRRSLTCPRCGTTELAEKS
jgi:hypothetical protein